MVKQSIVCICLFALVLSINANKFLEEFKGDVEGLVQKLNKIDEMEKEKIQQLDQVKDDLKRGEHQDTLPVEFIAIVDELLLKTLNDDIVLFESKAPQQLSSSEAHDFAQLLTDIEKTAETPRHKRQTQMNPMMMQQQQQQFMGARSAFPTAPVAAAPAAMPSVAARNNVAGGLAPFEKMRLAPFGRIRTLAYGGADPAVALNANGNPLPNTCARGYSEPIWEGFEITESYCRCPGDDSYGFTCQEGFGNPCANNDQQFFPADSRIPNNYFVHCSNYVPYLKKCPAGLIWDQELYTCNWPPSYGQTPAYGGSSYPAPTPSASSYGSPAPAAAPSYSAPQAAAAPSYSAPQAAAAPSYSAPQAAAAPSYSAPQAAAAPSYSAPAPQAAAAPSYNGFQGK